MSNCFKFKSADKSKLKMNLNENHVYVIVHQKVQLLECKPDKLHFTISWYTPCIANINPKPIKHR